MKHFQKISILLWMGVTTGIYGLDRNPIGETAQYIVDRNPKRTSSLIREGRFDSLVQQESIDTTEPSYDVQIKYNFQVIFDEYLGEEIIAVPKGYFSKDFLIKLREEKLYEAEQFKIAHLGFRNTKTIFNVSYPQCDYLRIYDIKNAFSGLKKIMAQWGQQLTGSSGGDIEDLEIFIHTKYGIPVLGAVKIDVQGKYNGLSIKAGADIKPQ